MVLIKVIARKNRVSFTGSLRERFFFFFSFTISSLIWLLFISLSCLTALALVVHMVKNMPGVQKTQVRSLGQEDPLEKRMATHSSILAWRTSWTEEPGGLQSMVSQRVRHDWDTFTMTLVLCWIGVVNWAPLSCFLLLEQKLSTFHLQYHSVMLALGLSYGLYYVEIQ